MKSHLRILFAVVLCLFICQTNVEGQIFKKALDKVKGAVGGKVSSKTGGATAEIPKGPAKPLAPEVKNNVSEIRSYCGLTKEEFLAKMKSKGFVEGVDETGMGLDGQVYKSKSAGYLLAVKFGTRGSSLYVRSVSKGVETKNAVLPKIKTTFLDYGKQCANLKAEFNVGYLKGVSKSGGNVTARNLNDWNTKLLPAFDTFISTKEMGMVNQQYHETCYDYIITYSYRMGSAIIVVQATDLTIDSQEG